MDTLIPINVIVGDRSYRVRVAAEDEEIVRKTVKVINDKLVEFKTEFAGKDMQDYIAMVVLWYATQQKAAEDQPLVMNDISEKYNQIEATLNKMLQ